MRNGQIAYIVGLSSIVIVCLILLGVPTLAANSEDRQAIVSVGSSALGVLATLASQAYFRERKGNDAD